VDLRRLIAIIRTWFPLLVASVVLAAAAAYVVSNLQEKTYESKATLIVGQSLTGVNPDYTQLLVSQRLSTTYATVATTRPVLAAVIEKLGLDASPDDLRKNVAAEAPIDSTLVTVNAQATDPEQAAAIANALSEELIAASPAIQGRQAELQASIDADLTATQAQITTTQARIAELAALTKRTAAQETELTTLEGRLVTLRSTYATLLSSASGNASNLLSVVEPAVASPDPVAPRPLLNTLLAAVLGLMIAIGIITAAEYLRDAVKDPEDVQEVTGLSTLGIIARMKGDGGRSEIYQLAALLYPRSSVTEAYRTLRTNVEFASVDTPVQTLLVTSSMPGEGKTVTAANLAVVFAQAGRRVLLVDADLRQPGIHRVFDLPNAHGLTSLLRRDDVSLDAVVQGTEQDNLRVLTTGPLPPNPAELLGSHRMRAMVDRFKGDADLVIVDSPPLQAVTDAAILSSFLDGTLFVIDAGRSRRRAVRLAREALNRADATVLGAVLNRVPVGARSDYADYYGGAYGTDVGPAKPGSPGGAPERSAT
jgi:succinoglycan biosynthesis transport protein ExoP